MFILVVAVVILGFLLLSGAEAFVESIAPEELNSMGVARSAEGSDLSQRLG